MDGFELLLQASQPLNDFPADMNKSSNKYPYPSSGEIRSSLLVDEGGSAKSSTSNLSLTPGGSNFGVEQTLPHMLDKYSAIYNKHGRVGIYTREERAAIVSRFHEKRKRRVWRKKIRYFCRKNLADRRVRVKGRFVKAGGKVGLDEVGTPEEEGRLMIKLKRGAGGLAPMIEAGEDLADDYDEEQEELDEEGDEAGSEEGGSGSATKSDSNTTNSSNSVGGGTPPLVGAAAGGDSNVKLHFLSSMLGELVEEGSGGSSSGSGGSGGVNGVGADFGPNGKKMRRHSIAY